MTEFQPMTLHHLLGQSVFDVEGDEAWGETFFTFHAVIGNDAHTAFRRYADRTMAGDDVASTTCRHAARRR